jgi:hypothetical protein
MRADLCPDDGLCRVDIGKEAVSLLICKVDQIFELGHFQWSFVPSVVSVVGAGFLLGYFRIMLE